MPTTRRGGGVGERRITFENFLHLNAAVRGHAHLEFDEPLQPGALRKSRIGGIRTGDEPLQEIVGIFAQASPEGTFETSQPAFEPVRLGGLGCDCWRGLGHLARFNLILLKAQIDAVQLYAHEGLAQSSL